jgi:hypothetical protein
MWSQVEQALNQSATNVVTEAAGLLPGVIALVASLLLAALVGWLLGSVLRLALRALDFDRRVSTRGWSDLAPWMGAASPTLLLTRLVTWSVIFIGFLIGLAALDPTLTSQLANRLFGSAINLAMALILLVVGNVLARFLARSVLISLVNMNVRQARLLSLGVKWLVLILSFAMALDYLGIGGRIVELAFGILFGGVVLALALAVGLRSKDFADWSLSRPQDEGPHEGGPPPFRHL